MKLLIFFLLIFLVNSCEKLFYGSYKIIDLSERRNYLNLKENQYRVKKGENLYLISKKKSVSVNDLITANNIKSPFKIYPNQIIVLPIKKFHIVKKNDTLYSISRKYGVDRFQLSKINNLRSENKIIVGQNLIIPSLKPTKKINKKIKKNKNNVSSFNDAKFAWPIKGEIISNFGVIKPGLHNDGINILSRKGKLVFASGSGKVIYTGNEIPGYGNLVLIKHKNNWITAYAHLDVIKPKKGEIVKRGDNIGTIGTSGNVKIPQLHFEIRKGKKALNPLKYLS